MIYDKDYYPHLLSITLDKRLKDPSGNDVTDEYDPSSCSTDIYVSRTNLDNLGMSNLSRK